jgi:predicted ester cyclase
MSIRVLPVRRLSGPGAPPTDGEHERDPTWKEPTVADNTQVVRSIEEAWDRNDLDALDQYFAADFDNAQSGTPGLPPGLAGSKMSHQGVMAAFPDRRVTILDLVGDGDTVVVRSRVTGTNTGGAPFLGAPEPNGAKIDFEMWSLYRLRDGRVVAHCGINDGLRGMMQVGSLTPPM